jgi:uncharacterized membrane protein YoaK (UPF0700 family)
MLVFVFAFGLLFHKINSAYASNIQVNHSTCGLWLLACIVFLALDNLVNRKECFKLMWMRTLHIAIEGRMLGYASNMYSVKRIL